MSNVLDLIALSEPVSPQPSGRLGKKEIAVASGSLVRSLAGNLVSRSQTPSIQLNTLVVDPTGCPPQMPAVALDATTEIALDQLRAGDQILIHTLHSTYIFLITDPAKQLGQVVGGVFGDYAFEALLDTVPVAYDHRLRTGMRVLFLAAGPGGKRVTTSVINKLVHRPAETRATR